MTPLLQAGDRLLVLRAGWTPRRGDVVVADVAGTWRPSGSGRSLVVKRVIGLPGETVACCDAAGRVTVDGRALDESVYLAGRPAAPGESFSIAVPAGRILLLGDARERSDDAPDHLGNPGGGTVAVDRVLGRAIAVVWPLRRGTVLERVVPPYVSWSG